jgi:hypothetical protein
MHETLYHLHAPVNLRQYGAISMAA